MTKYKNLIGKTGANIIYNKLVSWGIKDVHLYSGGAIMGLVDEFHDTQNNIISSYIHTHEQSLGHAATGYAKSSGKMGVSIVTSGPGLTNIITPMLDSTNDSTPLMVISGQVSRNVMGTNAFQECDAVGLSKSATKFSYCIKEIEELPYIMDIAYKIANTGKKGTVHIDLPKDISSSIFKNSLLINDEINITRLYNNIMNNNLFDSNVDISLNTHNNDYIEKIAKIINNSKKPILYVGQGCNGNHKLLTYLVDNFNIPVTTTIHAMGVYDENNELSLEMLGMHGNAAANIAIQEADLIICIGARFDDRTTGNVELYAPEAKKASINKTGGIIHNNIEFSEINKTVKVDFPIIGDSKLFLSKINNLLIKKDRNDWLNRIFSLKKKYNFRYNELKNGNIKTQTAITKINNLIQKDAIITTGVGSHQMMTAQFIKWNNYNKMITSGSLGVMGVGVPYAIGAKIANPDKQVIVIDGDSSFMMTLGELKTIAEYNLDIKIAIMNNHTQGMVKEWEKLFFDGRITATTNFCNPKFELLAETFGIKGFYCDNINDIDKITEEFLNFKGPALCEYNVIDEICLPLVKPGCALDDMLLEEEYVKKFDTSKIEPPS